jgi:rubrerythrin
MKAEEAKKILSLAIDREVEAYTFYRTISDKAKDKAMKSIFDELAGEEKKHREFLQAFLAKEAKNLKFEATKKDYKIVEALPTPPLSPDLKPTEGLIIAIRKELEAMQMYTQLANASSDTEQQFLFQQLANMEKSTRRGSRTSTPTWRSLSPGKGSRASHRINSISFYYFSGQPPKPTILTSPVCRSTMGMRAGSGWMFIRFWKSVWDCQVPEFTMVTPL